MGAEEVIIPVIVPLETIPKLPVISGTTPTNNQYSQGNYTQEKLNWIFIIIALSILAFVLFLVIKHYSPDICSRLRSWAEKAPQADANSNAATIASLPTFTYPSGGESRSQCIVCLSALKEGEAMKLLPKCKHLFHAECVDMWLGSHSTCPMCRADVKRWRGRGVEKLVASAMMQARGGGEVEMVREGKKKGEVNDVVVDLERQ